MNEGISPPFVLPAVVQKTGNTAFKSELIAADGRAMLLAQAGAAPGITDTSVLWSDKRQYALDGLRVRRRRLGRGPNHRERGYLLAFDLQRYR